MGVRLFVWQRYHYCVRLVKPGKFWSTSSEVLLVNNNIAWDWQPSHRSQTLYGYLLYQHIFKIFLELINLELLHPNSPWPHYTLRRGPVHQSHQKSSPFESEFNFNLILYDLPPILHCLQNLVESSFFEHVPAAKLLGVKPFNFCVVNFVIRVYVFRKVLLSNVLHYFFVVYLLTLGGR